MSRDETQKILDKINLSICDFSRDDQDLLTNDANERSISHKLAEHLQKHFRGLKVDCEYNRHGDAVKKLERPVIPDIVIHKRGIDEHNLCVIEIKKSNSNDNSGRDEEKLCAFTGDEYKYQLGVFLVADINNKSLKIERIFQSGQEINDSRIRRSPSWATAKGYLL